jgi:hypothetical protein
MKQSATLKLYSHTLVPQQPQSMSPLQLLSGPQHTLTTLLKLSPSQFKSQLQSTFIPEQFGSHTQQPSGHQQSHHMFTHMLALKSPYTLFHQPTSQPSPLLQ